MKRNPVLVMLAALGAGAIFILNACQAAKQPLKPEEKVARGKYLVAAFGCSDCHTPMKMGQHGPEPDMSMFLAGHPQKVGKLAPAKLGKGPWVWAGNATNTAYSGPWGISYAFNLTPDEHTGIGIWTEDMFMKAMREGKHFGAGRPIMPPMPWRDIGQLNDEDLSSMFAYLKSLPPTTNQVPDYQPPAGK